MLKKPEDFSRIKIKHPITVDKQKLFEITYSYITKTPLLVRELINSLCNFKEPLRIDTTESILKQQVAKKFNSYHLARPSLLLACKNSNNSEAIIPMHEHLREGLWRTLENYIQNLIFSKRCDQIELYSGPIFSKDRKTDLDENIYKTSYLVIDDVAVPNKFFRIVNCKTADNNYVQGFVFDNKKIANASSHRLLDFKESISEIQKKTGLFIQFSNSQLLSYEFQNLRKTKKELDEEAVKKKSLTCDDIFEMAELSKWAQSQSVAFPEQSNVFLRRLIKNSVPKPTDGPCIGFLTYLKMQKALVELGKLELFQKDKDRETWMNLCSQESRPNNSRVAQVQQLLKESPLSSAEEKLLFE